jgi:tetratricopeptide (TPR) repeat protein
MIVVGLVALSGCGQSKIAPSPCDVALVASNDPVIRRLQERIRQARDPVPLLEKLGWVYVEKARKEFDPGFYKLAEQTALCMEDKSPRNPDALLLRGHVLHSLHKFKEGETLARELVAKRGSWFDYALLGDVLMEQGRLDEAIPAYQAMMDQKPGPQAYARAAHIRWLKGDLSGAIELMRMGAGDDPWMRARLAFYEFQSGDFGTARAILARAEDPPALLVRGRILLAEGHDAIEPLQRAARATQLPEYLWTLAEAQRAAGQLDEAKATEKLLKQHGAQDDPRTFALFLATRGEDVETAVRLAREELQNRQDVFTFDVLAWALHAAGNDSEARAAMQRALAEGTQDARLALHAAVILGAPKNFQQQLLLPSEQVFVKNQIQTEEKQ